MITKIALYTTPVTRSFDSRSLTIKSHDIVFYDLSGIYIIPIYL
jgi:hypothetical protein